MEKLLRHIERDVSDVGNNKLHDLMNDVNDAREILV